MKKIILIIGLIGLLMLNGCSSDQIKYQELKNYCIMNGYDGLELVSHQSIIIKVIFPKKMPDFICYEFMQTKRGFEKMLSDRISGKVIEKGILIK